MRVSRSGRAHAPDGPRGDRGSAPVRRDAKAHEATDERLLRDRGEDGAPAKEAIDKDGHDDDEREDARRDDTRDAHAGAGDGRRDPQTRGRKDHAHDEDATALRDTAALRGVALVAEGARKECSNKHGHQPRGGRDERRNPEDEHRQARARRQHKAARLVHGRTHEQPWRGEPAGERSRFQTWQRGRADERDVR